MVRLKSLLNHALVILPLMFLVFLVLDQFNPMMNFTNHAISQVLLAVFCLCSIVRSLLDWAEP